MNADLLENRDYISMSADMRTASLGRGKDPTQRAASLRVVGLD